MTGWTRAHVRHLRTALRFGARPAVAIYESIGTDFFLAPAPGWLNLGWWDGDGDETEAARACSALARKIAEPLPRGGVVLDVANGLAAQDVVIADLVRPHRLIALNLTEFQLRAGRARMREAGAHPIAADAMRIPLPDASVDGVISIEAAFHFPSRATFFAEARRVLRPGGVLSISDIGVERTRVRDARELIAGLSQMRFWGIRRSMLASSREIAGLAEAAGFTEIGMSTCTPRVIDPALRLTRARLARAREVPRTQIWAGRTLLRQVELLRSRGMLEYILLNARA